MRSELHHRYNNRRKPDKGSFSKNLIALFVTIVLVMLVLVYILYISPLVHLNGNTSGSVVAAKVEQQSPNTSSPKYKSPYFPRIVNYMWKTSSYESLPTDTLSKWVEGCKSLNKLDYVFHLYDDDYLRKFTETNYPAYFRLFKTLTGVYMADMARVLIAYHYGGIYMDLDFYCHKPFRCLEKLVQNKYLQSSSPNDILVVSNEPSVHAWLFKNKSRVIIQDFFMATPKHPFFKFILDNRLADFHRNGNTSVKGPFSYHIHKDIDAFQKTNSKLATDERAVIVELTEDVLHPLVDSSNHKLYDKCPSTLMESGFRWLFGRQEDKKIATLPVNSVQRSCELVKKGLFFRPTGDTILVHMWTHVYLGWNFIRRTYNSNVYSQVETILPQSQTC